MTKYHCVYGTPRNTLSRLTTWQRKISPITTKPLMMWVQGDVGESLEPWGEAGMSGKEYEMLSLQIW